METKITTSTSLNLRDILYVVFKRKREILLFFFATVCTVGVGTFLARPIYEASAQVLIKIGRENLYVPTLPTSGDQRPYFYSDPEKQINSEIEIIKSRFLAKKVVESLGATVIYPDIAESSRSKGRVLSIKTHAAEESSVLKAASRFQDDLEVEHVEESDIIELRFKHSNPDMASTVLNTLVDHYLERHVGVYKIPHSYEFSQEQVGLVKNRLQQAEERLHSFKNRHKIASLGEERTLFLGQQAALRNALNQTLTQEAETEDRIGQLRKQLARVPKTVLLDEEIDNNPWTISQLQTRLMELQLREQELLTKYNDQSRLVQQVRADIVIVRNKLVEEESRRYGKTRSGLNTIYQNVHGDLLRNEAELRALQAKRETQTVQLEEYEKRLAKLNRIEVELGQLQNEVEVERQNYRLYLTKFEESRISDAMDREKIANVSLVEPAQPPLKPVSPRVILNMMLAVFLGLGGGLGLAFLMEYLDDSLELPHEVEECLQLPVLASIPELKNY